MAGIFFNGYEGSASVYTYASCAWPEGGDQSPGAKVKDSCKLVCGYQESTLGTWGLLQEQQVLFTTKISL